MSRAVFLDRDNTIIHNDGDLGFPDDVRLIQGAATAIASLCGLGYKIVVITNQGGVARGRYNEDDVMLVHERIAQLVQQAANGARIDRFYYCPYHPDGTVEEYRMEHPWRKPQPGMLLQAAQDLELDLTQSWTIGDQVRDVQAGAAGGTRTILLRPDLREGEPLDDLPGEAPRRGAGALRTDEPPPAVKPDYVVRTLVEAVRIIAQARKPSVEEPTRPHVVGKKWDAAAVRKLQESIVTRPPESPPPAAELGQGAPREVVSPRSPRSPRTSGRPFRPWEAQPSDEDDEPLMNKLRRSRRGEEAASAPSASEDRGAVPARPAEAAEAPPLTEEEDLAAANESRVVAVRRQVEDPLLAAELDEPAHVEQVESVKPLAAERSASPPWHSIDQSLRLLLQEVRSQRGMGGGEFSYLTVLAIVLQMSAALCLLGGLWMGAADPDLFQRWIAAGIIVQLATIATLLFSK